MRLPGIALAARAAAQLAVDPARLVPLGADDLEPGLGLARGPASLSSLMSVPRPAMLVAIVIAACCPAPGHDLRLALVVLGVQHLVLEAAPLELARQRLRDVHVHRADQDRPAQRVQPLDLVDDRVVLFLPGLVDPVGLVVPADRPVGRDDAHLEPVDRVELGLLGLGGAGHAGQLVVHPEVVLDGDRGEGLGLALDLHLLLGLDRLVQPVGPAPARHDAAGELVHDHHLAVLHQVVHFLLVEDVRLQQLVDDVELLALERVLALDLRGAARSGRAARGRGPCRSGGSPRRCPAPGTGSGSFGDIASAPRSVRWTEWPFSSSTK